MIRVTIYQNGSGQYCGFRMEGHAEFAAYGKDIVCAAVSAFTEEVFENAVHQEKDVVSFEIISNPVSSEAGLLMESLVLGLTSLADEYGKKYIRLKFKRKQEV